MPHVGNIIYTVYDHATYGTESDKAYDITFHAAAAFKSSPKTAAASALLMKLKEGERITFFISGYKGLVVQAVHVIKTAAPKSPFNGQLDNRLRLLVKQNHLGCLAAALLCFRRSPRPPSK